MTPAPTARTVMRRVPVSGGEIEFDVAGRAQAGAPAILLLHGWALDRRLWAPQIGPLSEGRLVIAIDRRGSGASSAPPDLVREADDIDAVLDGTGAAKAIVVGMSQAGRVAAHFALRRPQRTAGVVFQGARLGSLAKAAVPDIPIPEYSALVRNGRLGDMKALWRQHPLMRLSDQAKQPLVDRMLDAYSGLDLLTAGPAAPDLDDAALASIEAPVMFVTGAADTPLRRQIAMRLSTLISGAERAEIEDAGHLCNLCAPGRYNELLGGFLDRIAAGVTARTS